MKRKKATIKFFMWQLVLVKLYECRGEQLDTAELARRMGSTYQNVYEIIKGFTKRNWIIKQRETILVEIGRIAKHRVIKLTAHGEEIAESLTEAFNEVIKDEVFIDTGDYYIIDIHSYSDLP